MERVTPARKKPVYVLPGRAFPDRHAAENAVKAVVNIEAIQQVEMPQPGYDPFLEFFGIPQDMAAATEVRSTASGGPAVRA